MFLKICILLAISVSFAVAQTADSTNIRRDSVGTYRAVPVIVHGVREDEVLRGARPLATADLRDAEDIAASSSLSEVLPFLHSSLDVRSYGTLGGISLPSFRGLPPEYISVYRNGIKLTNAQNSLTDLERYTSRTSSKVDIISSAQSLAVAGDIAGAIINIASYAPLGNEYTAGLSLGSYDDGSSLNDKEYFFRGSQYIDATSIKLLINHRVSDGAYPFYQRSSGLTVERSNNDAYLTSIEVEPTISLGEEVSVIPLLIFTEAERGVPGAATIDGEGASSPKARQYDRDWLGAVAYKDKLSDTYRQQISLSYQSQYETYVNPTIGIDDAYRNLLFSASYSSAITHWEKLTLFPSLEYDRNGLESNQHASSEASIKRERYSLSTSAKYVLSEQVSVSGSIRSEKISDVEAIQLLPAAGITYSPVDHLLLSLSASRFFHAPTFNQLYWSVGGNPDLIPEQGESYELTIGHTFFLGDSSIATLQGTVFQTDIRDQIIWTPGDDGIWSPVNVQQVRVQGIELDARGVFSVSDAHAFALRIAGTVLRSINLTPAYYNNELPYSIPLRLISTASYQLRGIGSIDAAFTYRERRYTDFANNTTGILPFVATVDFHLRSSPFTVAGLGMEVHLAAINLTNEQYEEVLSFPHPGRMLKLSFDFIYKH